MPKGVPADPFLNTGTFACGSNTFGHKDGHAKPHTLLSRVG